LSQAYTFDSNVVSDLYKDAHGFRPSSDFWQEWSASNDHQRQEIWDNLVIILKSELQRQHQAEQRAVAEFENRLRQMILTGAGDRTTAIEWMHREYQTQGDAEYLCFRLNLPYDYLNSGA